MKGLNRNLIALALGASLVAPSAFAAAELGPAATPTQTAMGAGTSPGKGNWWQDADTDGDGKLSNIEANVNAGLASRFGLIDANKDGFVTGDEYRVFYTANASQGEQHAATYSAVVNRDVWVRLDADADSRISMAEAAGNASLVASFAAMDSNTDSFVTQDEFTAHTQAHN